MSLHEVMNQHKEDFRAVVIIPAFRGREDNLKLVVESLRRQSKPIERIIVVDDGGDLEMAPGDGIDVIYRTQKHEPGMTQPRNLGVEVAEWFYGDEVTHAWFVDSDVVINPDAHEAIAQAYGKNDFHRIMVNPYYWLRPGLRPELGQPWTEFWKEMYFNRNDPRQHSFDANNPMYSVRNDLSAGLACFSGNLVWNIEEFKRVGGFWSEIHHGRCEDGELGLRAVAMDVPISFNNAAFGAHLHHPVNVDLHEIRNRRDVPMLNDRHPWVQQSGVVFMVDRDGKAFDAICPQCQEQVPTIGWWDHASKGCPSKIVVQTEIHTKNLRGKVA